MDPDALALLVVQQYLFEKGFDAGERQPLSTHKSHALERAWFLARVLGAETDKALCWSALDKLEKQSGMLFMGSKLAEGSVLMQVGSAACPALRATVTGLGHATVSTALMRGVPGCSWFTGSRKRMLQLLAAPTTQTERPGWLPKSRCCAGARATTRCTLRPAHRQALLVPTLVGALAATLSLVRISTGPCTPTCREHREHARRQHNSCSGVAWPRRFTHRRRSALKGIACRIAYSCAA